MYLKNDFKDADNARTVGKAIKGKKMISILKDIPEDYLLNTNGVTGNINILDAQYIQIGYIDIAEEE